MRPLLIALAALGVAACAHRPPSVGPEPVPYEILRHQEERKLGEGVERILIDNPYGEIQVRQTGAAAIAMSAVEQRIGRKPRAARIEWFHEGKQQGLRIRYPGLDPRRPADPRRGRVDLVVFLPAGPKLELIGGFGDIVVRRVANEVLATSESGRITIAARGGIAARSKRGAIRIFPMEVRAEARYEIITGGEIYAELPVYAPLALEVESRSAPIFADLSFSERQRAGRGERATLRLGSGEVPFRLRGSKVALVPVQAAVP